MEEFADRFEEVTQPLADAVTLMARLGMGLSVLVGVFGGMIVHNNIKNRKRFELYSRLCEEYKNDPKQCNARKILKELYEFEQR